MTQRRLQVVDGRILILGLAFKENCPDLRNTRVVDIIDELSTYHAQVDIHDPWVDPKEAAHEYGIDPVEKPEAGAYDAVILAVGHREFAELGTEGIRGFLRPGGVLYDIKHLLPAEASDGRL
jgi:UDP-N-acetyl-D-galactosamine dehydrogenase